jgi:4-amino-4-deoxy-L-arabinose transferase-like glycosyltransferase
MNMQSAALFSLLTAFVSGLVWALYSLAKTHSLSSFLILCALTFAVMTTAGYAVDQWESRSQR